MRAANIVVAATAALWFVVFLLGRDLVRGVYLQGGGIAPNAGQIDYYIVYPLMAVVLLMFAAWVGNMWRKPLISWLASVPIGLGLFPFLMAFTGGI